MGFWRNRKDSLVDKSKKMTNYEEVESIGKLIGGMAKSLHPANVPKKGKVETFQSAYERLGTNETILAKIYRNFFLRFYISAGIFVVSTLFTLSFLLQGHGLSLLAYIGFAAVCLAQMFATSFRMYQMRSRQLFGVSQWLKHKEEWFPKTVLLPPLKTSKGTSIVKKK